ncbi:MAG: carbohydrate ABC transporter permease, partial [Planctomycetota bacterium]
IRLVGPEFAWAETHPQHPAFPVTLAALEHQYVVDQAGSLRWDFVRRNYINVWRELTVQGRVLINTALFCGLAIVLSLLVNPLAAYALSRFRLKATYKVLLILIATMAFPPMVTMIPQFIMLRNLGLLNTFIALVLPLIVNGYMIFLLKGFFDALPQELYEAAMIDGAGEWRMFFQITMALSKPILAILALGTFTGAYTMFLYPLLVAPDQDMWLMSVWLFQFQQRSTSAAVFASVIIASVPTMLIFLFTQRMIMRGIVVPTEK